MTPELAALTPLVSVETRLPDADADRWWQLYYANFAELETRSAARQVLHREEFVAEMADPRVLKFVARTADGTPIGLTTLTRHLETVPWISPAYFAHHYPEHTARGAVFYLGFTLVHAAHRHLRVFRSMLDDVVARVAAEDGVCGWDMCLYNDQVLGLGPTIEGTLRAREGATVQPIDEQRYYAVTYASPSAKAREVS